MKNEPSKLLLVILAIIFPPATIGVKYGWSFTTVMMLNIVLCILGWFPGTLHSLYHTFRG